MAKKYMLHLSAESKNVYTTLPTTDLRGLELVTGVNELEYLSKTGSILFAFTRYRPNIQLMEARWHKQASNITKYIVKNWMEY